jgi:hypothetical protein
LLADIGAFSSAKRVCNAKFGLTYFALVPGWLQHVAKILKTVLWCLEQRFYKTLERGTMLAWTNQNRQHPRASPHDELGLTKPERRDIAIDLGTDRRACVHHNALCSRSSGSVHRAVCLKLPPRETSTKPKQHVER